MVEVCDLEDKTETLSLERQEKEALFYLHQWEECNF